LVFIIQIYRDARSTKLKIVGLIPDLDLNVI